MPAHAKRPCVYLLASKRNGTLSTGVTSNLPERVWEHKNDFMAALVTTGAELLPG